MIYRLSESESVGKCVGGGRKERLFIYYYNNGEQRAQHLNWKGTSVVKIACLLQFQLLFISCMEGTLT